MDTGNLMPDATVLAAIRDDIEGYEQQRGAAHRSISWRVPAFLASLLVVVVAIAVFFNGIADPNEQWFSAPHVFLYVTAFVVAFFVYSAAVAPATRLQRGFREKLLPRVFGFIDDLQYSQGGKPESFDRLPRVAVGQFNRQSFDDVFGGKYDGFPFELYEATLSQKQGKSTQTVFRGVVVAFETISPFPGVLVASRRAGTVTKFFRDMFGSGGLQELQSGVASLDQTYEFRSDNVEAARPLVTGRLARALQWMGETWPEEPARVALQANDGYLFLPFTKNFFELPGIGTPVDYKTHIEPMIADMVSLLATASLVRKVGAPDDSAQAQP